MEDYTPLYDWIMYNNIWGGRKKPIPLLIYAGIWDLRDGPSSLVPWMKTFK